MESSLLSYRLQVFHKISRGEDKLVDICPTLLYQPLDWSWRLFSLCLLSSDCIVPFRSRKLPQSSSFFCWHFVPSHLGLLVGAGLLNRAQVHPLEDHRPHELLVRADHLHGLLRQTDLFPLSVQAKLALLHHARPSRFSAIFCRTG